MMWWLASLECSRVCSSCGEARGARALSSCCDEQEMDEETKKQLEEAHELTLHRPRLFHWQCFL